MQERENQEQNLRPGPRISRGFRLRSRASLIAATVALQALVIGLGALLTLNLAQSDLATKIKAEEYEDKLKAADRFVAILANEVQRPIEYGNDAWKKAQILVETYRLPGGTIVYLVDEFGNIVCHPLMNHQDAKRRVNVGDQILALYPAGDETPLKSLAPTNAVVGRAETLSGPVMMAVAYSPALGVKVVVQQHEAGVAALSSRVIDGTILLAGLGSLLALTLTALGSWLLVRRYDTLLERANHGLEEEIIRQVHAGLTIRNGLIFGLAKLADYRDTDTGKHLERICTYCDLLAMELARSGPPEPIDSGWIERLKLASSMHDIGKVGIPDQILLKPGRLTTQERRLMEQHPLIGADTLVAIRRRVGQDDLLDMGIQVTLYHHERWDGGGYPFGLEADQIPLAARIVALADVYDAITSERVYKKAMSHDQARQLILSERGKAMDPRIVDAFDRIHRRFDEARKSLQPDGGEIEKPSLQLLVEQAEALKLVA